MLLWLAAFVKGSLKPHHHHGVPLAQIFLLSPLVSIVHRSRQVFHATSRIITEVLASLPTLARLCEGVIWSTSLMSSLLLLQQCLACPVSPNWLVFEMGVGVRTAVTSWDLHAGLIQYSSQHFCAITIKLSPHTLCQRSCGASIQQYWHNRYLKKQRFIFSDRFDFHKTDSLSLAVHAFSSHVLTLFSVDETLLPR